MFDSRKQNPHCDFAEEVVSYIYEEMLASEKDRFENHLAECPNCTDEITALSSVSFSLREWKNEEFATLTPPNIEIPYETEKPVKPLVLTEDVSNTDSWLDKLSGLFGLSPVFLKTATALGTLLVVIGLGWFLTASIFNNEDSMAKSQEENLKPNNQVIEPAQSIDENQPTELNIVKVDKSEEEKVSDEIKPNKEVVIKTAKSNSVRKAKIQKATNNYPKQTTKIVRNNKKTKPIKKDLNIEPKQVEIKELPRLTDFAIEETDDKDLRLTDFFAEDETGDE